MKKTNSPSLFIILKDLVEAQIARLLHLFHLAALEAQLAIKTLVSLAIFFFIVILLSVSSWLLLNLSAYIFLTTHLNYAPLTSALTMTLINFILLMLVILWMVKLKSDLFFPATRKHITLANHKNELGHE